MGRGDRLTGLWVAFSVLLGLFVGAAAGFVRWTDGHNTASALLSGGAGCGATITLTLLIIQTLHGGTR